MVDPAGAAEAAIAAASAAGLPADDAVVLQGGGNRFAVRVLPCDTLARVGSERFRAGLAFEIDVALALASTDAPVAGLDPRVEPVVRDHGAASVALWTYHAPVGEVIPPEQYADALRRLHESTRDVGVAVPDFRERVAGARGLVADVEQTPDLSAEDRAFLGDTIDSLLARVVAAGAPEQLLHGEPHPGNLLLTAEGPLFIDLETTIRGPVAFDVAHAPAGVARHYPGLDRDLLRDCRLLSLALVTTWRWERHDSYPDGRRHAADGLRVLRSGGI